MAVLLLAVQPRWYYCKLKVRCVKPPYNCVNSAATKKINVPLLKFDPYFATQIRYLIIFTCPSIGAGCDSKQFFVFHVVD
jgi:hypothetical protein